MTVLGDLTATTSSSQVDCSGFGAVLGIRTHRGSTSRGSSLTLTAVPSPLLRRWRIHQRSPGDDRPGSTLHHRAPFSVHCSFTFSHALVGRIGRRRGPRCHRTPWPRREPPPYPVSVLPVRSTRVLCSLLWSAPAPGWGSLRSRRPSHVPVADMGPRRTPCEGRLGTSLGIHLPCRHVHDEMVGPGWLHLGRSVWGHDGSPGRHHCAVRRKRAEAVTFMGICPALPTSSPVARVC